MFNSIGTDLEVFAVNKKGEHVALCGLIGGTKTEPKQLENSPKGYMVQEDNVALEFNIPVCYTPDEFVHRVKYMRTKVKGILADLELTMSTNASVSFDKNQLTHPNALVFGCEPDYDAWRMCENERPVAKDPNLRSAGGHIHVGTQMDMVQGVQNMDLFLGVPSVLLDDNEHSRKRRELYGKPGALRPKPYGFEYRTLSNFWMFSDKLVRWAACNTINAVNFDGKFDGKKVQEAINTGNKFLAEELIKQFKIPMPDDIAPETPF